MKPPLDKNETNWGLILIGLAVGLGYFYGAIAMGDIEQPSMSAPGLNYRERDINDYDRIPQPKPRN